MNRATKKGFTLIELSIVLVIIGLIVGGVLVGQDLIRAAEVRATISQVERYNTAVNAFHGKYGALPGDIPAADVVKFGFTVVPTRAGTPGQGDGNGIIEGYQYNGVGLSGFVTSGETAWFWEDLTSNTQLVQGNLSFATETGVGNDVVDPERLVPPAAIGKGNFFYVYSLNKENYFGLSFVTAIDANGAIYGGSGSKGLTVGQAYAMDSKMDDGFPQTGNVVAFYQNWSLSGSYFDDPGLPDGQGAIWASGGNMAGASDTSATSPSSNTCYDNAGVEGATQRYSLEVSNGLNVNCALSFRFQ